MIRFLGMRWTLWLRVLGVAVVAGALALATGVSFGSEAGNAPSYSSNAPDPVSAQVIRNGANNASSGSANDAEFQLCFNKQVQTIGSSNSAQFVDGLELIGYGAGETGPYGGGSDDRLGLIGTFYTPQGYSYTATAASNPSNPNCVNVTIGPAPDSPSEPGVDLNGFTEVGVTEGVAQGLSGLATTPGSVGLDPVGTPEVAPRIGATTGPQITSIIKSPASPTTLTYVFDYLLDPQHVTAGDFCYYASGANNQPPETPPATTDCGNTATVNGNQVTVTFNKNVVNDVYYEVYPGAVFTQTTDEANPGTSLGGTLANIPTLRSVAKVPGVAGAYDLTYDQCVTAGGNDPAFVAVLEDDSMVHGAVSSRPSSDCTKVRITFGSVSNFADYANKVVLIGDGYCGVVQQASPGNCSAVSGAPVNEAPNMMKGYTNGPNLIGFSVDLSNSTATYYFDNQYGGLERNSSTPNVQDFGLLYKDGTNSLNVPSFGQGATFTGPNQVTVQFNPAQLGNASNPVVAGILGTATESFTNHNCFTPEYKNADGEGDCEITPNGQPDDGDDAVVDYEGTEPVSPLASGIGIGGYVATTTTTTSASRTTTSSSHSSTSTTTTQHVVQHQRRHKCPPGTHLRHGKCVKKHKHHKHHKKCPPGTVRRHGKCVKIHP